MDISGIIERIENGTMTDSEKDNILSDYVNYSQMEKESKKAKEELKPVLYKLIGTDDEIVTENHKAWLKATERKSFNEEGLKEKYPDIWKEFSGKNVIVSLYAK